MVPNVGGNEDEDHIRNGGCHSTDPSTTLRI